MGDIRKRRTRLVEVGAVVAAAAAAVAGVAPLAQAGPPSGPFDGVWRVDGYGTVIAISDGVLRSYQTTAISCVPEVTAVQLGSAGPGGGVAYTDRDHDVFTMRPGAESGSSLFDIQGSVGDRHLRRVLGLPSRCAHLMPADPVTVFDVFWETYAENYPFFSAKGIDWQRVRSRYRPLVTSATTDAQLLGILAEIIAPLNDAHTVLADGHNVIFHSRPGTTLPTPAYNQQIKAYIQQRDVKAPLQDFANGRISYADLPGNLGYLRISGFGGYTAADDFASNSAELNRALDAVFTPARTQGPAALKGLIIDVRVNTGGSDALAMQVAARLTDRPYVAYAKQNRDDPHDPAEFTKPQPIRVEPGYAPPYRGPVTLLTGGSTVSAGETFTQALQRRTPRVVRIGENTQGVFSDIMVRGLPNGWFFGLPNEEYLNAAGRTYDGAGVPPDVRTPVFTSQEFTEDRDSAFDRAVEIMTR